MFGNYDFNPPRGINFVKEDIRNEPVLDKIIQKSDVIVHLAGVVGEASYKKNPDAALDINQRATRKIIDSIKKHNKKTSIHEYLFCIWFQSRHLY